ncbi:hypothetical protein FBALC1_08423 [Flavobacteriales bacterium ALC-1]|nr:hypothetical protein FBALC1_08423 [Flavobacteriales bacterium ALC-1]
MEIEEKLIITIVWIIGMFILIRMMRDINNRLKSSLDKTNPKLTTDVHWFFSSTKKKVVDYIIIGMTLIWLLMIWTNKIPSFL